MNIVLLDRDGTLIVDPPDERVDTSEKIQLFPDTLDALRFLAEHDFGVIIITNQSGIAEGTITEEAFWQIHENVLDQFAPSGITVLKTYMNGDTDGTGSTMRKPAPGMLYKAAKDYHLNLGHTYMVGDRLSDVQAGINAGAKTILVNTGLATVHAPNATYTATSLMDAVQFIVTGKPRDDS